MKQLVIVQLRALKGISVAIVRLVVIISVMFAVGLKNYVIVNVIGV
jgi:phage shock protein PspC (stress-responsive transcriptional regulator)